MIDLPFEILRLVFDECLETHHSKDVISASHVSKHWQISARGHRLFVAELRICEIMDDPAEVAVQLRRGTRRIKSAPLPLAITIIINPINASNEIVWRDLVAALAGAMTWPGVRELMIHTSPIHLDILLELFRNVPAPMLQSLHLSASRMHTAPSLDQLFAGSAPVLRDVVFVNLTLCSIIDRRAFAGVQRMKVFVGSVDVQLLLPACPVLRCLTLSGSQLMLYAASRLCSTGPILRKLELIIISWPSDQTLDAMLRLINLSNVSTVCWTGSRRPPDSVLQGLLLGLPTHGLSFAMTLDNSGLDELSHKLSISPAITSSYPAICTVGVFTRELVYQSSGDFTLWPLLGMHRVVHITITHLILRHILGSIPTFCLPQLLEMHIQDIRWPEPHTDHVELWDSKDDLANGRHLTPMLRKLTLSQAALEGPLQKRQPNVFTAAEVLCLATHVLGLTSGTDPAASFTAVKPRPHLRMVNLRIDEQRAELCAFFQTIEEDVVPNSKLLNMCQ